MSLSSQNEKLTFPRIFAEKSLDLSVGAFQAIGDMSSGVLPISWNWA